jgi:HlyD family secretion protein
MWRPAVTTLLLSAMGVGLGYAYNQDREEPPFLTAPIERGTISTLVRQPVASMRRLRSM